MRIGLLALGGWLVAAVLTVAVSWSAISVVRQAVVASPEVASGLPRPEETPGGTARPTATPGPTGGPATGSATGPTAGPTATSTPRPGPTRPATTPAARVAVANGVGGTATVRCTDGRPVFVNLTPRQGFSIERDDDGGGVEFRSSDHRTRMAASCADGVPGVTAEEKSSGGGDDDSGRSGDDD